MPLLPLVSVKASPGVTVSATAIAAAWPRSRPAPYLVECDAAGGDLAANFGLTLDPGLVSLAVALERNDDVSGASLRDLLLQHSQELPGGLRVVVAPTSPEEMRVPLERLAEDLPRADCDVIADCGRLQMPSPHETTPALRLLQRAGLAVVVTRPVLAELQHVHVWLPVLTALRVQVLLLLTPKGQYSAEEISATLGVRVIGSLPHDTLGASMVAGAGGPLLPRRLGLLHAARGIAAELAAELPTPATGALVDEPRVASLVGGT